MVILSRESKKSFSIFFIWPISYGQMFTLICFNSNFYQLLEISYDENGNKLPDIEEIQYDENGDPINGMLI